MMSERVPIVCRVCLGSCGLLATIAEDGQISKLEPDREHPVTQGYACFKGLQTEWYGGPERLTYPMKRGGDGSYQRISLEQALSEIADKVQGIISNDSPRSVAGHYGTAASRNVVNAPMLSAWLTALGSPMLFTTMTIDQPAKYVTPMRLGSWGGGKNDVDTSDVVLIAGGNPVVSQAVIGFPTINPNAVLKRNKARGMKIIVIDPRETETSSYADIHLQPLPGEDPTVAAGLIRIILEEGLENKAFCERHVEHISELRAAVAPFTPAYVQGRAQVNAENLIAAARMFAAGRRGAAYAATGPAMALRGNLSDHLYESLNVIGGRFKAEGEAIANPNVLGPRVPKRAEVIRLPRSWEVGVKSRIRDIGTLFGEMMTGILPDEILTPGPGQVKALFVVGANPVNAWPDQAKAIAALERLELLVSIDTHMTATAGMAHYILPPKVVSEIPNIQTPLFPAYEEPFAQYVPPVASPPAGSEVADEHFIFWDLARRMGKQITFAGELLDMDSPPNVDEMLSLMCKDAQIPLDEVRKYPRGKVFDVAPQFVEPASAGEAFRFDVMPGDVAEELAEVASEEFMQDGSIVENVGRFTHRLACRRMRNVVNTCIHLSGTRKRHPYNPAYMNPDDLRQLGISPHSDIEIESPHGRILAVVEADKKVRSGVVSISHGWGGTPGKSLDHRDGGSNVNLLVSSDVKVDPITALPRMSAIPVRVSLAERGSLPSAR